MNKYITLLRDVSLNVEDHYKLADLIESTTHQLETLLEDIKQWEKMNYKENPSSLIALRIKQILKGGDTNE